jgi:secondary thiamine-phosphate synthase enzyme
VKRSLGGSPFGKITKRGEEVPMPLSFTVKTRSRTDMVDITPSVQKEVSKIDIADGVCVVYIPHTTAGVTINEGADPAVCDDIMGKLDQLVPRSAGYRHAEGNADSHIKASIVGSSVTVLVEKGRLLFGTWQKMFLCEFDGPRSRKVYVKVL